MIRSILGALSVAAMLSQPAFAADDTAGVSGFVLDARTHAPLAATVTIAEQNGRIVEVTTNRRGQFSAIGLEPGNLTVSFAARGFDPEARTCRVPGGETGRFDFRGYRGYATIRPTPARCDLEPSTVDRYVIQ